MRILAIETTDQTGTVAVADDGNVLFELELDRSQRSAQSLAPAIQQVLKQAGWQPNDVQLAAVAVGPGSFTGLRVGVASAKVFAYAVGAEVLGIDTLDAIAVGIPNDPAALWVAMDAQRGDVVARRYVWAPGSSGWASVGSHEILPLDAWVGRLEPNCVVAGPLGKRLLQRIPSSVKMLGERIGSPRAGNVARLAARDYASGRRDDLWTLLPVYTRRSAAEEKWDHAHPTSK